MRFWQILRTKKLIFWSKIMKKKNPKNLVGELLFEGSKIILNARSERFFVRGKLEKKFLHGDVVLAKITKKSESGRMTEVAILKIMERTQKTLLGQKK